jgi:uncharacterized protein DUF5069
MNLTQTTPRSVREKLLGLVQLARTTDKAKALAHGTIGEYEYPSAMDEGLFEFLGMKASDFLDFVKVAKSDAEIEGYIKNFVGKKSPDEVASFNQRWMTSVPKGESLEHFTALRTRIAPDRIDVTTWPDLLDLDEGRSVAHREPATISRKTP